jgi:hypothetical protein
MRQIAANNPKQSLRPASELADAICPSLNVGDYCRLDNA